MERANLKERRRESTIDCRRWLDWNCHAAGGSTAHRENFTGDQLRHIGSPKAGDKK